MFNLTRGTTVAQKAPNAVIVICGTLIVLTLIGSVVALSVFGKDTDSLFKMLNTLLSATGALAGTGAFLYSSAAARAATHAEETVTNGDSTANLDERIQSAVIQAMQDYRVSSVKGGDAHGRPPL